MNKIWTALLYKAIQALLSKDWNSVVYQVGALMHSDLTGEEKRSIAFITLRNYGVECATWLLYAAIEIAYGQLKAQQK
jgi:hypothetical protein